LRNYRRPASSFGPALYLLAKYKTEAIMTDEKTSEPMGPFYYPNVQDSATKQGYIAADIFLVVYGLFFLYGLFWPHH
jgi:hypothetical protein